MYNEFVQNSVAMVLKFSYPSWSSILYIVIETGAISKVVKLSKVTTMRFESVLAPEPNTPPLMPTVELDCNAKKNLWKEKCDCAIYFQTAPLH
jgi:hypothetical protein